MSKFRTAIAAALLATTAGVAMADEVWETDIGDVIYERDMDNGMAVLSYPLEEGDGRGEVFLAGLAGDYETRATHKGIWVEPDTDDEGLCSFSIAHPETGEPVMNWGRVEVIFMKPAFPTGFVAKRGRCFDAEGETLVAWPVVAE